MVLFKCIELIAVESKTIYEITIISLHKILRQRKKHEKSPFTQPIGPFVE